MSFFRKVFKEWKHYVWITLGVILTALSINIFLVPFKIAPGGVSGAATVIYYMSGGKFPVGITMLILNIPLFLLGIKYIGKRFIIKTLYATIMLSVVIDVSEPFTTRFLESYLTQFQNNANIPDLLLYSLFGGFIMGAGLGMVFRSGATTGGTDLAARIVNHFIPNLTMGQLMLIIDGGVVVFASVAFSSVLLGLYAIVTLYVSSKVVDAMLEGVNFAKVVLIISEKSEEIAQRILTDLDRGVTALHGKGLYTGNEKEVLLCVIQRGQLPALKEIAQKIDEKAFIILTDIREVLGEGFKTYE